MMNIKSIWERTLPECSQKIWRHASPRGLVVRKYQPWAGGIMVYLTMSSCPHVMCIRSISYSWKNTHCSHVVWYCQKRSFPMTVGDIHYAQFFIMLIFQQLNVQGFAFEEKLFQKRKAISLLSLMNMPFYISSYLARRENDTTNCNIMNTSWHID